MINIRPIRESDDEFIRHIIQSVGAEFGAVGEGFGPSDPEVLAMSKYFKSDNRSQYLVASLDNEIVGGCGIAPLSQSEFTCELCKLFLLPHSRGLGIGELLVRANLGFAKSYGFEECYLDTLDSMNAAISLYEKLGFIHLLEPYNNAVHSRCNVWMLRVI